MSKVQSRLSRRAFLQTTAVLAAGSALAACVPAAAPSTGESAGSGASADTGTATTTITYWTFWADRWGEFQQQIVDDYNATHDQLQVEMLIVPWGDLATKLLTAVSAGNPPDFSIINRGEVVEWAVRGGVMALDDFIDASAESNPDDWFPVAWGECVWEGKSYAQPFESGTYAAWYNTQLFADAGLDPAQLPTTWAEVDAAAAAITSGNATDGYERVGFIPWGSRQDLLGWLAGGEWYDEESQAVTAVTPENIAGMTWVKQYADQYGGEALERFRQGLGGGDTEDDPFYRNQIAMAWKGSWSLSSKTEYAPDVAFNVLPLPYREGADNDSINQGSACVLPTGSPQPEPAYEFLSWMSINGVAQWVPNAADMVSRKDQTEIYPNALPDNDEFRGHWKTYNDALAYAHHEPSMPARRFWNDQLSAAVDAIVLGQKTPEQALQDAQDATQRELDKALGKA
ncbi:MAG: ABC transporter substrate-binding protein [Caldilineaceae bacterium]|nr:ABC transporter substrate-binding protein [Caldilineaceae bacterium]